MSQPCLLCYVCVVVWRNDMCICIVVGYIWGYLCDSTCQGGVLNCYIRLMGWFWGLLTIVSWIWLCNLWVWVVWGWFSHVCCKVSRCWLWGFELVVDFLKGFFGCGCKFLMCIGCRVGVGIGGIWVWGCSLRYLFGVMVRSGCIALCVSRILGRASCIWLWLWWRDLLWWPFFA